MTDECEDCDHEFGPWEPAPFPWSWQRTCEECGYVERTNGGGGHEFRPE